MLLRGSGRHGGTSSCGVYAASRGTRRGVSPGRCGRRVVDRRGVPCLASCSELRKAKVLLSKDLRESKSETKGALAQLTEHSRGKRKATIAKEEQRKKIKIEKIEQTIKES